MINPASARCLARRTFLVVVFLAGCLPIHSRDAKAAPPSAEEQLWLELINRFRASPIAELDALTNYDPPVTGTSFDAPTADDINVDAALVVFGVDAAVLRSQFDGLSPMSPLAWNVELNESADYYNSVIIANDQQSHFLDGLNLVERVTMNSGYDFTGGGVIGENLFATTKSVIHGHSALVIDWSDSSPTGIQSPPSHREALLNSEFREIGIAITAEGNDLTGVGPLVVTQHLAVDFNDGPFLTGVAFLDQDGNDFYTPGEGLGGIAIDVFDTVTLAPVDSTVTWASGGYALELAPGTYDIRFSDANGTHEFTGIDVVADNVKLDYNRPVPEPTSFLTACCALVGVVVLMVRRRRL